MSGLLCTEAIHAKPRGYVSACGGELRRMRKRHHTPIGHAVTLADPGHKSRDSSAASALAVRRPGSGRC